VTAQVEKIPTSRLRVIYNGYNQVPGEYKKIDVLHDLKGSGAVIFGLVANIRPIKRMQDAIEALALLSNDYANAHLVIVGAGSSQELMQLAGAKCVAERVHFMGGRSDISDCLQYFDVGLLCSESEGFSNAIVEYQFAS
jgi:L-malate glycosyltransferase